MYNVKVKDIPVRYNRQTYKPGDSLNIEKDHLKGREQYVEVLGEVEEAQKTVDEMTLAELNKYAADNGIDLGDAKKKIDVLKIILDQPVKEPEGDTDAEKVSAVDTDKEGDANGSSGSN